ncbi:MAG: GTP cyclohydrolase I FolE [Candidatus Sumerlaeales bacterium]|nr:GTP cyclohydrolase I FolE [Candidatus Sumerlaeales bacterium]
MKPPKDKLLNVAKDIECVTTQLLRLIGEDPNREGLLRTPERVARSWAELTAGYTKDLDKVVNGALFREGNDGDMVITRNIKFFSMCEHHLLPFHGRAVIAYIPRDITIGLSKIPRIVDMYARRLQLQERLTHQVADALEHVLNPRGVAVYMEAEHMCVMMRGVKKDSAETVTSCFRGEFKTNMELRDRFMMYCITGNKAKKK